MLAASFEAKQKTKQNFHWIKSVIISETTKITGESWSLQLVGVN